jgi:GTP:adenosylcobinamide-phosphate guanylyltransferase
VSGVTKASAIVLAGRRDGSIDPLAAAHGVADKCLVPVLGTPCIEHVLIALAASPHIDRITVSINDPAILDGLPQAEALRVAGRLTAVRAEGNLADSVIAAAGTTPYPLLVTTADNVLMTPASITEMVTSATATKADAAAAFSTREAILAAHPEGQRRFYEFADGGYSNCNSYWIARPEVLRVAEIFRSGGQFAKNPKRLVDAFGLINILLFRWRWISLASAMRRISSRMKLSLVPIVFADGSYAIDVDNERTHACASEIMARRRAETA